MPRHIVITKGTELHRFPLDALICVSADGNYSEVMTVDGRKTLICLQLGQIEALMVEQLGAGITNFVRLGRGLIINIDYINQFYCYRDGRTPEEIITERLYPYTHTEEEQGPETEPAEETPSEDTENSENVEE